MGKHNITIFLLVLFFICAFEAGIKYKILWLLFPAVSTYKAHNNLPVPGRGMSVLLY